MATVALRRLELADALVGHLEALHDHLDVVGQRRRRQLFDCAPPAARDSDAQQLAVAALPRVRGDRTRTAWAAWAAACAASSS